MEATLGFAIDSAPILGAVSNLDRLTQSAEKVDAAADRLEASMGGVVSSIDRVSGASKGAQSSIDTIGRSFGSQDAHVTAFRAEIDRLTMRFDPLAKATKSYQLAVGEINSAHKLGVIDAGRMTKLLDEQTSAYNKLKASSEGAAAAMHKAANANGLSEGNKRFIARDVGFQLQDVATTAYGGMSPSTIAFQQGPQLAGALQGLSAKEAGSALLSAATGLLSPVALLSVGLTGLTAAAIGYFSKSAAETKSLDDLLEEHEKLIKRIGDAYGDVATKAAGAHKESKTLVDALGNQNATALRRSATSEAADFFSNSKVGTSRSAGRFGQASTGFVAATAAFQEPLKKLQDQAKAGKANFDEFYAAIEQKVELDPSLSKAADIVVALSEKFKNATDAAAEYKRIQDAIFADRGPNGMLLSQGSTNRDDMKSYEKFVQDQQIRLRQSNDMFKAQVSGIQARTIGERIAAARSNASATYNDAETAPERRQRINQAGALEETRIQKEMADAARDRSLSLDRMLSSQREELSLVGQTGGAAEGLRKQFELIAALQDEAAKNGGIVSPADIQRIKDATTAYGALVDQTNLAKLNSDLDFQDRQFRRTPQQQQVAATLRQNGQPEDLDSPVGKRLAANAQRSELDSQIKGISSSLASNIINSGGHIGKAFGQTFLEPLCGPAIELNIDLKGMIG